MSQKKRKKKRNRSGESKKSIPCQSPDESVKKSDKKPELPEVVDGNIRPDFSDLDEKDVKLLEDVADKIVRRRMSVAAIFMLESFKPMNFIGSQLMTFMDPGVSLFFNIPGYNSIARLLEERENLERFITLLEYKEALFQMKKKDL